ncbi:MAG: lytic transglycosylase domain-containing protein [Gammaproteobacteria bacterium]|nr:lytic transglycosylase domain-containing protein [Gammaproteobacteria bacterium]
MNPSLQLICFLLCTLSSAAFAQGSFDPKLALVLKSSIQDMSEYSDRFDAEVWLKDMSERLKRYVKDPVQRIKILKLVHRESKRQQLSPEIILSLIEVESHFDQFAISVAGARGLMQIMPFWLKELNSTDKNLFHLKTNIRMGCTILKYYVDMEKGNLNNALARYNGSYGKNKYPDKVYKALEKHWYPM